MPLVEYRLRVRNASDSADLFTASSVRGNGDDYLLKEPDLDGNEFDPFTGQCRCGSAVVDLIDTITSGTDRVVTAHLEDANQRPQLLRLKAFLDQRKDGGSWQSLIAGQVGAVRYPDELIASLTINDPTQLGQQAKAFAPRRGVVTLTATVNIGDTNMSCAPLTLGMVSGTFLNFGGYGAMNTAQVTADVAAGATTIPIVAHSIGIANGSQAGYAESIASYMARWPTRGCILGGPIIGGFAEGRIQDLGGWTMEIADKEDTRVWLKFREGYSADTTFSRTKDVRRVNAAANDAVRARFTSGNSTNPYGAFTVDDARGGSWPGLIAELRKTDSAGTLIGYFCLAVVGDEWIGQDGNRIAIPSNLAHELVVIDKRPGIFIHALGLAVTHETVKVRVYSVLPDPQSPVYWNGHPLDLLDVLQTESDIPHDASAAEWAAVRHAIGDDTRVAVRFTESAPLNDVLANAVFARGIGQLPADDGTLAPFCTGIFANTPPTTVITADDVVEGSTLPFALEQGTSLRTVTFRQKRLVVLPGADSRWPDGLAVIDEEVTRSNGDPSAKGDRDVTFEIPGMVHVAGSWDPALVAYADAAASQLFDRGGRGLVSGETTLLRGGAGDGVRLGDEILFNLPQVPNHNKRLGDDNSVAARAMQIVRYTPVPEGAQVKLADSGPNAQPVATLPVLTLAASSSQPRNVAQVTITNAATLNAAGIGVRIRFASAAGTAPASTAYTDALYYPPGSVPTTAIDLPGVVAGRTVGVIGRSEQNGKRPSNWSTPVTLALTGVPAPTSVTVTPNTANGAEAILAFTAGADDVLTDVWLRLATTDATLATRHIVLPAGSDRFDFTDLTPGAAYVCLVEARDPRTGDTSSSVEVDFTAAAAAVQLPSPSDPYGFAGAQDARYGLSDADGVYGLAVVAIAVPGEVEIFEAVETAPGSNVFGTATSVGRVPSVPHAWTLWTSVAPRDRCRRQLTARHVRDGSTASDFTDPVTLDPWTTRRLPDYATTQSATNLIGFSITSDTATQQVRGWTWGARLAAIFAYQWLLPITTTTTPEPTADQWPDAVLQPGTNSYTLTKPPVGMRLYVRLEARLAGDNSLGQVREFSIDPPGAIAATFTRTEGAGSVTLGVTITDPAAVLDPVHPLRFRVTRDHVSTLEDPTTAPGSGTAGDYTRVEVTSDKHTVEIEPVVLYLDGTEQTLASFTFDSDNIANAKSIDVGLEGDQATAVIRWDTDTSTAEYRIDGGSALPLAVAGDQTSSLTETVSASAAQLLEVRGYNASGVAGPWYPAIIPQLPPTQLVVEVTLVSSSATQNVERVTVTDPIPQAGSYITVTPSVSGCTVTPNTPQMIASGGYADFTVDRPSSTSTPGRFNAVGSAPGRVSNNDAAEIAPQDTIVPALDISVTPGATSYSFDLTVQTGTVVDYRLDGGAWTPLDLATDLPLVEERNDVGGADKVITFRGVLNGQTETNSVTIPSQLLPTMVLNLGAATATGAGGATVPPATGYSELEVPWTDDALPTGATIEIVLTIPGGTCTRATGLSPAGLGGSSHTFTGVTFNSFGTGAPGNGRIDIFAKLNGNVIATDTHAGIFGT